MGYHSQFGEDKCLVERCQMPSHGYFIEVGAYDGVASSNTLAFEEMGWSGICIEPDPSLADRCKDNRKAFTFTCAISDNAPGYADFFVNVSDRGQSSLVRKPTNAVIAVPTVPLRRLIEIWQPPRIDLLSVDTEGTELDVWASIGEFRPTWVIMEYLTMPGPSRLNEILQRMEQDGYRLLHTTVANAIFEYIGS